MTKEKQSLTQKANNWLSSPKTFLMLAVVVVLIILGSVVFSGNSDKRYLDDQGWNVQINEGGKKTEVNVYFAGDKAYGFVKGKTDLPKKNASQVKYDKKRHQVNIYGSQSKMSFLVSKKKNSQVEGTATFGNSSQKYSYVMTKDDTIQLK